jgi:hypothetical protein
MLAKNSANIFLPLSLSTKDLKRTPLYFEYLICGAYDTTIVNADILLKHSLFFTSHQPQNGA